jgi:hypothetical protein
LGELVNDRLIDIPKLRFPHTLEIFTDGATQLVLDHMVRVIKRQLQATRQLTPHGGFS